ncbi:MAG TPA: SsrA-binding protein, partial [Desulfotomaculum sp.]|nr:SsrA-binding protein [Desulfotomaculum sp.]
MKEKIIAVNRKARHEYHIMDTFEAGIALTGTEVKSLRAGQASLQDSYARVENAELFLYSLHISPFEKGNRFNHDPRRTRKLLMHKREIIHLLSYVREKGLTIIPLRLYFNEQGRIKV